jgi:DNA-directed RNA polymerase subunit H (RpoH/RPB5)
MQEKFNIVQVGEYNVICLLNLLEDNQTNYIWPGKKYDYSKYKNARFMENALNKIHFDKEKKYMFLIPEQLYNYYIEKKIINLIPPYLLKITDKKNKNKVLPKEFKDITFFITETLIFDITKNIKVPKHEKLSNEELNILLQDFSVDIKNLPHIKIYDPISKWKGFEVGDVVKITRIEKDNDFQIYYRLVVQ